MSERIDRAVVGEWGTLPIGRRDARSSRKISDLQQAETLPEIELAALWSNEGDDMTFILEGPMYGNPGSVALYLTSNTTNRHDISVPDGVDNATLTWLFYGGSIAEVVADALAFARELDALHAATP
jgi:hypothetical protein